MIDPISTDRPPAIEGYGGGGFRVDGAFHNGSLIVLPTGEHPLKSSAVEAPPEARLELASLAFGNIAGVEVSDYEVRKGGPCYTVDTLQHFHPGRLFKQHPAVFDADVFTGLEMHCL